MKSAAPRTCGEDEHALRALTEAISPAVANGECRELRRKLESLVAFMLFCASSCTIRLLRNRDLFHGLSRTTCQPKLDLCCALFASNALSYCHMPTHTL
jgi:hypothetical protein